MTLDKGPPEHEDGPGTDTEPNPSSADETDKVNGNAAGAFNPRAFRRSLRRAGITLTQYRVAVELCEYASQERSVVWPSVAVLAEDCELGRSTVIRVLGQLESKGFIVCAGGRTGGRGCSTRWRLIVKGLASETLSDVKGLTSGTLSDGKRVPLQTKRVPLEAEKGPASGTRRREEEGRRGEAADAANTPPRVSRDGEPGDCCPEHVPDGIEDCDACYRAWHKHESWEAHHPQSWDEYTEDMLHGFREEWIAQGPPRMCDLGHPLGAACGTCGDLRQMRKEWDRVRAQFEEDRTDRREDIGRCHMCDRSGRVWIDGDPDPWWCDHGWGPNGLPLSSFGTVSSVPPDLNCEAVSDRLDAIHSQPDGPPGQNGSPPRRQCACGRPAPVDAETGLCLYCSIKVST